jgi:DNA processing protein
VVSPNGAEVRALLVLDATPGIGLVRVKQLVASFGSAEAALAAPDSAFEAVAGAVAVRGRRNGDLGAQVDAALAEAERLGMDVCTWASADYPHTMLHLHDPPPVLFLRGRRELLSRPAVTIVGARHATPRARDIAERLGQALARAGVNVASGLALGVDGAAHRGALAMGGDTVAVLGRGADRPYPLAHRGLFRDIVARGLVVSEFLPGTPPLPHHFPRRNRILAALARAVVVVEAGATSGSLITVDHALDLGIEVWAVPGPIEAPTSEGSNRLLAEGARPLLSIAAFVEALTGVGAQTGTRAGGVGAPAARVDGPPGRVLASLGSETLGVDQLATRLGLSVSETLVLLTALELGGLVCQLPGMRFRKAA